MKKSRNALILFVGLLILTGITAACAGTNDAINFDELIAEYEPSPCNLPSYQETYPFNPIVLNPYEMLAQIERCKSSDEVLSLSRDLGLPLADDVCAYIAQCKNDSICTRYSLPEGRWEFSEAITLAYTYADYEASSDNMVLVFTGDGDTFNLIDILNSVDNLQIVTDANHEDIWFVGETRYGQNQSTRWYNLGSRKFDLSYLVNGLMADRNDYHVKVRSFADPIVDGMIAANGMFAVRKQISLVDITSEECTADTPDIILYTQIDIYAHHAENGLTLVKSKKYQNATLESVAGITCEQIINTED